ncbi:MAG: SGNH/GDSL hydrolase family protein [Cellulosilyticaceae bacterium]
MTKRFKTILSGLLVCGLAATAAFTTIEASEKQPISQIVAFGDSYSDNGSANAVSTAVIASGNEDAFVKPGELYWENRYSNGKTAVEVLAEMADLPLTNFATGGATSGFENYTPWMDSLGYTGVLGQIDKYAASLNGAPVDPNTLHFMFISANDYFRFVDFELEGELLDVADQAVANIKTGVETLAKMGAKQFFISGSSDLSLVPYEISVGRADQAAAFRDRVNSQLPSMLQSLEKTLDVSITFFDVTKVSDEIVANPNAFGITVLDKECQPTYPEIKPVAPNQDQYYFFDEWHFTRIVHRTIGERMYTAFQGIK